MCVLVRTDVFVFVRHVISKCTRALRYFSFTGLTDVEIIIFDDFIYCDLDECIGSCINSEVGVIFSYRNIVPYCIQRYINIRETNTHFFIYI